MCSTQRRRRGEGWGPRAWYACKGQVGGVVLTIMPTAQSSTAATPVSCSPHTNQEVQANLAGPLNAGHTPCRVCVCVCVCEHQHTHKGSPHAHHQVTSPLPSCTFPLINELCRSCCVWLGVLLLLPLLWLSVHTAHNSPRHQARCAQRQGPAEH